MRFNLNKEFNSSRQELLDIITRNNYCEALTNWVIQKNNSGLTKKQIYETLLLLHDYIQKRPDPNDEFYNRLSDFLDNFTTFSKFDQTGNSLRILPNEPDI